VAGNATQAPHESVANPPRQGGHDVPREAARAPEFPRFDLDALTDLQIGSLSERTGARRFQAAWSVSLEVVRSLLIFLSRRKLLRRWMETSSLAQRFAARFVAGSNLDYAQVDVGFIGQNVYLFAASEGLNAWFYALHGQQDATAVAAALKLPAEKRPLYAQSVGYPPK